MDEIHELNLTLQDIEDPEEVLRQLGQCLALLGVTANGVFRWQADPETGYCRRAVKIMNNVPVLDEDQEVQYVSSGSGLE